MVVLSYSSIAIAVLLEYHGTRVLEYHGTCMYVKQAKQKTYFWRFNRFAPWCMTSARKLPGSTFSSQIKHPSRPMQEPWTAKSGKVALLTLFRNNDSCVVEPAGLRYPPVNLISTIRSFQKLDNGCDFLNCLQSQVNAARVRQTH